MASYFKRFFGKSKSVINEGNTTIKQVDQEQPVNTAEKLYIAPDKFR